MSPAHATHADAFPTIFSSDLAPVLILISLLATQAFQESMTNAWALCCATVYCRYYVHIIQYHGMKCHDISISSVSYNMNTTAYASFTYQFIIKLWYEILFAEHNVCLRLKKLQHVIYCHLQNQQNICTDTTETFQLWILYLTVIPNH